MQYIYLWIVLFKVRRSGFMAMFSKPETPSIGPRNNMISDTETQSIFRYPELRSALQTTTASGAGRAVYTARGVKYFLNTVFNSEYCM